MADTDVLTGQSVRTGHADAVPLPVSHVPLEDLRHGLGQEGFTRGREPAHELPIGVDP
jgi:hypothetical protein